MSGENIVVIMVVNGGFANQIYRYACAYATAKKYGQELIVIADNRCSYSPVSAW